LIHEFVICVLVIGLAALMIIGLLRLVQDLLSGTIFAAPSLPTEVHVGEIGEHAPAGAESRRHEVDLRTRA